MSNDGRRGDVFTLRLEAKDRAVLEEAIRIESAGARSWQTEKLGPWMVKQALARARAIVEDRDKRHRAKEGAEKAVRKDAKKGRRAARLEVGNTANSGVPDLSGTRSVNADSIDKLPPGPWIARWGRFGHEWQWRSSWNHGYASSKAAAIRAALLQMGNTASSVPDISGNPAVNFHKDFDQLPPGPWIARRENEWLWRSADGDEGYADSEAEATRWVLQSGNTALERTRDPEYTGEADPSDG